MKKIKHFSLFTALLLNSVFFTACISSYKALQDIEPGLTKQETRIELGKPYSVGRTDGLDRWTYKFKKESQEYTQDVFFEDGMLLKVGPLRAYPNYRKKMIEAETLKDYEINASLYQRQKSKGFREINSVKKKNDIKEFCENLFSLPERKIECENLTAGQMFLYPSLLFCQEEIKGFSAKLSCLSEVAGKVIPLSDLEFCANTKTFSGSSIQKLQCLRNSSTHPIPKSHKNNILVFNCIKKNITFELERKPNNLVHTLQYGSALVLTCPEELDEKKLCNKEKPYFKKLEAYLKGEKPLTFGEKYKIDYNKDEGKAGRSIGWFRETGNIICDLK